MSYGIFVSFDISKKKLLFFFIIEYYPSLKKKEGIIEVMPLTYFMIELILL